MNSKIKNFFRLFLPIIIGGIVGFLIKDYIDYEYINKPPLAPPKIFFPIAWSIIYLLMGISYYLFRKDHEDTLTTIVYYIQLFINALWSIVFFIFKWRFFSILWIILLDIFIILLIYLFYKKKPISAYLNIPYLLWSLFATYLTIGIYILN